jgi:NADH dehydrogenase FAD-containing subunit
VCLRRGIELVETGYVHAVRAGEHGQGPELTLENGAAHRVDVLFLAAGVEPSPLFRDSGLPTGPDGGLLVDRTLQCQGHPDIFGGGDCIHFHERPLDKVGVYAVRENPVLRHNLMAALETLEGRGDRLKPFDPGGGYLLVFNLGRGRGVLHKGPVAFDGRLAFRIKDYIDRKFIRRFKD